MEKSSAKSIGKVHMADPHKDEFVIRIRLMSEASKNSQREHTVRTLIMNSLGMFPKSV